MQVIDFSQANKNLCETLQQVIDNNEPLMITQENACNVVLISEAEYQSHLETMFLLNNHNNAMCLLRAIKDVEAGKIIQHDIIECEDDLN